jgi:hypothetical protein
VRVAQEEATMVDGTSVNSDEARATGGTGPLDDNGVLGNAPSEEDIQRQRLANDAQQRGGSNEGPGGGMAHDPSSHGMAGGRDTLSVISDTDMPGRAG